VGRPARARRDEPGGRRTRSARLDLLPVGPRRAAHPADRGGQGERGLSRALTAAACGIGCAGDRERPRLNEALLGRPAQRFDARLFAQRGAPVVDLARPDELYRQATARVAGGPARLMLTEAALEVDRRAGIERTVAAAQQVDVRHRTILLGATA